MDFSTFPGLSGALRPYPPNPLRPLGSFSEFSTLQGRYPQTFQQKPCFTSRIIHKGERYMWIRLWKTSCFSLISGDVLTFSRTTFFLTEKRGMNIMKWCVSWVFPLWEVLFSRSKRVKRCLSGEGYRRFLLDVLELLT